MDMERVVESLKELRQDYVDDRHYYTALSLAIETLERQSNKEDTK